MGFTEAEVGEGVLHGIGTANHDHVAAALFQFPYRQIDSRQRGGTRRIHREVSTTEVKPIGHAARRDIRQDARE